MNEKQAAIIARLKSATGPDDGLDLAIATWCYENGGLLDVTYDPQLWIIRHGGEFTGSLDWAVRLVPDGYAWAVENVSIASCTAAVWPIYTSIRAPWDFGTTAPLALCIAALKARWS